MADSTIITGQYVQIDQTSASIGERIFARLIDFLILMIYVFAVAVVVSLTLEYVSRFFSNDLNDLLMLLILLPAFFYTLLWEVFNHGQTLGKKLLGIRVVMKDGSVPTLSAYLLRWLLMMADFYLFQFVGALSILLTKDRQRLGDLAAGTIVIKEKNYHKVFVTLDEFYYLSAGYRPGYHPVFPQAENLSLEQINLIAQTLFRYDAQRPQRIRELADRVCSFLKINPSFHDELLLQTLMRDFQYYALEEI
ncbi:MAG: RDD family protein [Tannerella sp.]|jgi:uncharacterized RDD family membrane protein YckC|nr:RDD family protein [Tannerella sp.]